MKKIWLLFGAILAVLVFALIGKTILQPRQNSVGIDIGQAAPNIPITLVDGTNR